MKKAFTLIELLVVIAVIALLITIMIPPLALAWQKAQIVAVHAELHNIALGLEAYGLDNNGKFPPTRADCNPQARRHAYALPEDLVEQGYLPGGQVGRIRFASIEDRFNKGCAYKYIAVGPMYDYSGAQMANQYLYVPEDFPGQGTGELIKYDDPAVSPVRWALLSVGPGFDPQYLEERTFPLKEGFPVCREFWYSTHRREGILTNIRLRGGRRIGTFEE